MPGVVGQLLDNTKVASGESRCPWGHHPFHGLPCDGGDAFEVLVVVHDGYAVMLGDRRNDQVRDLDRAVKSLSVNASWISHARTHTVSGVLTYSSASRR